MMTAMGQGETQVSPYQMALITAAIANGGYLMKPYLIDSVTNYKGTIVSETTPEEYTELMTLAEASQLKAYMALWNSVGFERAGLLCGRKDRNGRIQYGIIRPDPFLVCRIYKY